MNHFSPQPREAGISRLLHCGAALVGFLLLTGCPGPDRTIAPADAELTRLAVQSRGWPGEHRLELASPDEPGERLTLIVRLTDSAGTSMLSGREVTLYHTAASGEYEESVEGDETTARLYGTVITDSTGRFVLESILPGDYREGMDNRHIHTSVADARSGNYDIFFSQYIRFMGRRWAEGSSHAVIATLHESGGRLVAEVTIPVRGVIDGRL